MSTRNEAVRTPVEEPRSTADWVKLIVGVAGGIALIVFFLQNRQDVNVNFLWLEWTTGLIWALLASAILGALSAVAFATIRARGRRDRAG